MKAEGTRKRLSLGLAQEKKTAARPGGCLTVRKGLVEAFGSPMICKGVLCGTVVFNMWDIPKSTIADF